MQDWRVGARPIVGAGHDAVPEVDARSGEQGWEGNLVERLLQTANDQKALATKIVSVHSRRQSAQFLGKNFRKQPF